MRGVRESDDRHAQRGCAARNCWNHPPGLSVCVVITRAEAESREIARHQRVRTIWLSIGTGDHSDSLRLVREGRDAKGSL